MAIPGGSIVSVSWSWSRPLLMFIEIYQDQGCALLHLTFDWFFGDLYLTVQETIILTSCLVYA